MDGINPLAGFTLEASKKPHHNDGLISHISNKLMIKFMQKN